MSIAAYPDADFTGMYGYERPTDPACAKSWSGFIIVFAGVPVMWQSKLQTETALSTMEAEIIALAACMRELIPIIDMVQSLAVAVGRQTGVVNMKISVHEDNSGALVLAETLPPQFTPRSKYYAIKTIWFREEIHKRGIKLLLSSKCRMSACRFVVQTATFCVVSATCRRHVSVMSQTQENVMSARVSKRHDI